MMMSSSASSQKNHLSAWLVCLSVAFFFFFDFVIMAMEGALKEPLQDRFIFSSQSAYTWCIANPFHLGNLLFILPAAYLLGRYSVRRITLTALGVAVGSAFVMSLANFWLFIMGRFCLGAAHAFCFLCLSTLVSRWFSPQKRGGVMGLCVAIGVSGIMLCQYVGPLLHDSFGLKDTMLLMGGVGVCFWLMAYRYVADYPAGAVLPAATGVQDSLAYLKEAMSKGRNWGFALFAACMNAPYMVLLLHLEPFAKDVHGADVAKHLFAWLALGTIIGNPVMGWLSQLGQSRKKPMLLSSAGALVLLFLLFYMPSKVLLIRTVVFVLGMVISVQVLSYPSIAASNPPYMTASAMSVASLVVMGSIVPFQMMTAYLLDYCGTYGVGEVYSRGAYVMSFAPFLLAVGVAVLLAVLMDDTFEGQAEKAGDEHLNQ